jgi:SM-20-related protein
MIVEYDLFTPVMVEELRKYLREKNEFVYASVTGDSSWRSGRVRHIENLFIGKLVAESVIARVPRVINQLGVPEFTPTRCEVQASSYGNGDYFRAHTDNGTPDAAARKLSWVSYLNAWPGDNTWTGGELHVRYDDRTVVYQPADGETVFFSSSALHEIMPVFAPPGWEHRRFSVNGWVS